MKALNTARLTIAPARPDDAADVLAYHDRNREHLQRWEPEPSADFYTLEYWLRVIGFAADSQSRINFLARSFERGDGYVIASVNVFSIQRAPAECATLGYGVDGAYEGRGYGREAVGAVVTYCFDQMRLHRVAANYQPANERSGRLLRSLGFVVEGYARDYLYLAGAWRDHILTARTNPAHEKQP